jgi:hypothetical protein
MYLDLSADLTAAQEGGIRSIIPARIDDDINVTPAIPGEVYTILPPPHYRRVEGHVEERGQQGSRGEKILLGGILSCAGWLSGDDVHARRGGFLGQGQQACFRERSNHGSGGPQSHGDYEIFTANRDGMKLKPLFTSARRKWILRSWPVPGSWKFAY